MIRSKKTLIAAAVTAIAFVSCKKDKDPVVIVHPSSGSQVELNGLAGTEAGNAAGNSVYLI